MRELLEKKRSTENVGSIKVLGLFDVDAVLVERGTQVLHSEGVSLLLSGLFGGLAGSAYPGELKGVVGDVRDELLRCQRDQTDNARVGRLETSTVWGRVVGKDRCCDSQCEC